MKMLIARNVTAERYKRSTESCCRVNLPKLQKMSHQLCHPNQKLQCFNAKEMKKPGDHDTLDRKRWKWRFLASL